MQDLLPKLEALASKIDKLEAANKQKEVDKKVISNGQEAQF